MDRGSNERYVLQRQLARSAATTVAVADDRVLGQRVVIKAFTAKDLAAPDARQLMSRAIAMARSVKHPNLVPVHDLHDFRGRLLITMPLVEGTTFSALLAQQPTQTASALLGILRDVARALATAHAAGVVHGGLDGGAILVRPDGSPVVLGLGVTAAVRALVTGQVATESDDIRAVGALLLQTSARGADDLIRRAMQAKGGQSAFSMLELAEGISAVMRAGGATPRAEPAPIAGPDVTMALSRDMPVDDMTLPLPTAAAEPDAPADDRLAALPAADRDGLMAFRDQSGSWVVGGNVVDLPAIPKQMDIASGPGAAAGHGDDPERGTAMRRVAVIALVAGGVLVAVALLRRPPVLAATDAGTIASPRVTEADAGDGSAAQVGADAGPRAVDAHATALAALHARGLIVGDDVEIDRLLDRVIRPADAEEAVEALAALTARAAAVEVDRHLVVRKLGRLRGDARALPRGAARRQLEHSLDRAERLVDAGQLIDANAMLNDASAALPAAR